MSVVSCKILPVNRVTCSLFLAPPPVPAGEVPSDSIFTIEGEALTFISGEPLLFIS